MNDPITQIIDRVIQSEAGFSLDPKDPGNWTLGKVGQGTLEGTNYGITVATARADGYTGEMKNLPRERAESIYRRRYVIAPGFDKLVEIDTAIGAEVVDTGVNMGTGVAAKFLQEWLNGFNALGSWPELVVDGNAGPATRAALASFISSRGQMGSKVMLAALNGSQAQRYLDITQSNKVQRANLYGWVRARVAGL